MIEFEKIVYTISNKTISNAKKFIKDNLFLEPEPMALIIVSAYYTIPHRIKELTTLFKEVGFTDNVYKSGVFENYLFKKELIKPSNFIRPNFFSTKPFKVIFVLKELLAIKVAIKYINGSVPLRELHRAG